MANITLTPVLPTDAGVVATFTDTDTAADTYYVYNNGTVLLAFQNGSAGSATVTIVTTQEVDGLAVADRTLTVAASTNAIAGPFKPSLYNNANGNLSFTVSGTPADLTCLAITL